VTGKKAFYFVVCGAESHINTLHFSIKYLEKFSRYPVIVLTDTSRNKVPIVASNILDIKTPENLDDHQASIFLKTSLHRYIDTETIGCYLDSDVIALSEEINNIFDNYSHPVVFARDHASISTFSPYAVNCKCLENYKASVRQLEEAIKEINPFADTCNVETNMKTRELFRVFDSMKRNPFQLFRFLFRFQFSRIIPLCKKVNVAEGFHYNTKSKLFMHGNEAVLNHAINFRKKLRKETGFSYNLLKMKWFDKDGNDVYRLSCTHLLTKIEEHFQIKGIDPTWNHWNGGVFLFSKESENFMEKWHQGCLKIFDLSDWKTRDQGTLIATVWEEKLQNHKVLDEKFNFLADYHNPLITWTPEKGFTRDNHRTTINPAFIHIYHQFGNTEWEVWKAIGSGQ